MAAGWYKEIDLSGTVELDPNESPPLASVTGAVVLEGAARPTGKMRVVLFNRGSGENFTTPRYPTRACSISRMTRFVPEPTTWNWPTRRDFTS